MAINKITYAIVALFLLGAGCANRNAPTSPALPDSYNMELSVGGKQIHVEVASTRETMAKGLSGREILGENQGMLFDYGAESSVTPGFWMPDMKFDIDIIWIKDGKIIGISKNVPAPKSPDEKLEHYYPPSPIDQVLEVNAGWSKRSGVEVGDTVKLID